MAESDDDCQIIEPQKSITCSNIPDPLLDRNNAEKHFGQFGKVHNIILRPKRLTCTVEYETIAAAEMAILDGCYYNEKMFDIEFTPKEQPKFRADLDFVDPDVQMELDAMGGSASFRAPAKSNYRQSDLESFGSFKKMETTRLLPVTTKRLSSRSGKPTLDVVPSKAIDVLAKNELESIMRKPAYSSEEKYRVLDARDKLIRLTTSKTTDIKSVVSTKGVCPDMCPEKERLMREATHHVCSFELEENSKNVNHSYAVKQYARSSADQEFPLAHELRPEVVLQRTMKYLLYKIMDLCDQTDCNLGDWFHFLWDRTRSIRKDISQQELCSLGAVELVEQCARMHIHCAARLVAEEPQVFDQKINSENLTKCLQSLKYLYHDLHLKNEHCPNEAEFRAYVILLNLNDCQFFWEVKQLPHNILHSPEIRFAIDVYLAVESNNYVKFFKLVRQTTYMNACILLRYFTQVRAGALSVLLKAYVPRGPIPMNISYWTYILAFEDYDQTCQFFEYYGMQCDQSADRVVMDRAALTNPDIPLTLDRAINVVEHKRMCSAGEAVFGGPIVWNDEELEKHVPHDSFDDDGYLVNDAWTAEDQNYLRPPTPKAKSTFREENNLFKIPMAPSTQTKTQQSPKSNIFNKLSPKMVNTEPTPSKTSQFPSNIFGTPFEQSKSSNFFGSTSATDSPAKKSLDFSSKTTKASVITSNVFGLQAFGAGSTDSSQKLFQLPLVDSKPSTNIFSSDNGSTNATTASGPFSGSNVFGTGVTTTKPEGNNIFGQISKDQPIKSGLFSAFQEKPTSSLPNPTSRIFGDYRDVKNAQTEQISSVNFEFGSSVFGQRQTSAKSLEPPVLGIVPLKNESTRDPRLKQRNEEDKIKQRRQLEEERISKLKEKADEAKQKELEILEKQRIAKEKKELELVTFCTNSTNLLLDEYVSETIKNMIKAQLKALRHMEENASHQLVNLLEEAIHEEIEGFLREAIAILNQSLLRKYFNVWRSNVRDIIENREIIEKTPIWLPEKPIAEHVPELHHPLQATNLNMRTRYRLGVPNTICSPPKRNDWIDVFGVVAPELLNKNRKRISNHFLQTNTFWKCIISLPDSNEEPFDNRLNKSIDGMFLRQIVSQSPYFCEQIVPRNYQHKLAVCLRKLIGTKIINESGKSDPDSLNGMNSIIFYMTNTNLSETKKRFANLLKNPSANGTIALVICGSMFLDIELLRSELNLDDMIENKNSSWNLDVFYEEPFGAESLRRLTVDSLKFVTSHWHYESPLEIQSTVSFLSQCLTDQLWTRVGTSVECNPALFKAVTNANSVISIYNNALDRLIALCSIDLSVYQMFANEFGRYVGTPHLDIPMGFEFFPENWKDVNLQKPLIEFLQTMRLNEMSVKKFNTLEKMQHELLDYASKHILDERSAKSAGYKMIQTFMVHIQRIQSSEEDMRFDEILNQFSWIDPIKHMTIELLSTKYNTAQDRLPYQVIYRKDTLKEYTTLPWWLSSDRGPLKNIRVGSKNSPPTNLIDNDRCAKRPKMKMIDPTELKEALERGAVSLAKADTRNSLIKKHLDSSRSLAKKLDESLYLVEKCERLERLETREGTN